MEQSNANLDVSDRVTPLFQLEFKGFAVSFPENPRRSATQPRTPHYFHWRFLTSRGEKGYCSMIRPVLFPREMHGSVASSLIFSGDFLHGKAGGGMVTPSFPVELSLPA